MNILPKNMKTKTLKLYYLSTSYEILPCDCFIPIVRDEIGNLKS